MITALSCLSTSFTTISFSFDFDLYKGDPRTSGGLGWCCCIWSCDCFGDDGVVLTTTTFPVRAAVGRGVGTNGVDGDADNVGLLCSVDDDGIVTVVVENVLEISSVVTVVGRMLGMWLSTSAGIVSVGSLVSRSPPFRFRWFPALARNSCLQAIDL